MEIPAIFKFLIGLTGAIHRCFPDYAHGLLFAPIVLLVLGLLVTSMGLFGKPVRRVSVAAASISEAKPSQSVLSNLGTIPQCDFNQSNLDKIAKNGIYIVRSGVCAGPFTVKQIEEMITSELI